MAAITVSLTAAGDLGCSAPAASPAHYSELARHNPDGDQDRKRDGQDQQSFILEQLGHLGPPVDLLYRAVSPTSGRVTFSHLRL